MRQAAIHILQTLREAGHTAYLAGGCVRDRLLALEPKDYDVATDAPPETVRQLFKNSRSVGESFGVVLVYLRHHAIEVATFRSEWGYHDGRRPDHVIFTDAKRDAQRRDFTINGLFEDPIDEQVIDYVGGKKDLEAGILRAIGDADERFSEDYLRMLRAVRFAARFDFQIDSATARAIQNNARHLGLISRERIGQEVRAMQFPAAAVLMQQLKLDGPTLHEDSPRNPNPRNPRSLKILTALSTQADYPTRLAAWLMDRHDERDALNRLPRWRKALCLSNEEHHAIRDALHTLSQAQQWPTLNIAERKRLLGAEAWPRAQWLLAAVAEKKFVDTLRNESQPLLEEGVSPLPWVTGDDLLAMGIEPGPRIGSLLHQAYDAQLSGELADRQEALAWLRKQVG